MEAVNLENIWEDWHIDGPPIGSGSFGTVYKAHKIEQNGFGRGYESAVKVIRVPSDDSEIRGFLADGMSLYVYLFRLLRKCAERACGRDRSDGVA